MQKMNIILLITAVFLGTSTAVQDYHGLDASEIHPGYDLMTIRPLDPNMDINGNIVDVYPETNEFNAPTVGLAWDANGENLLVVTWRGSTGPREG